MSAASTLPLQGIRVLELGHIVAGPVTAMILAELGADVIKVERPGSGDQARYSRGNQGYFLAFNSCKRSVTIDLKSDAGRAAFLKLVETADVVVDNYAPGALERLGLAYEALSKVNPRIITCGIRGFLPGPYGERNLLDEPAQMMGGLAYMTGPPGMPLRAGASVIDITGAMFSVIGILSALLRRERTGSSDDIKTGLFETVVFVVAQHIAKAGISGEVPPPMTERGAGKDLGWGIYRVFETKDRRHVFIGVTSDNQWRSFCHEFGLDDLWAESALRTNAGRRAAYDRLTQRTENLVRTMNWHDVIAHLEHANIPHAPVNTPADLFDHPHLLARNHLTRLEAPDGTSSPIPGLPIEFDKAGRRPLGNPPKLGEHSGSILAELGYSTGEIERLTRIPDPEIAA
jgi:crotonobetainyl-CoA:carnitine CoA-transferase CaiB-like acyl-CoA transferase